MRRAVLLLGLLLALSGPAPNAAEGRDDGCVILGTVTRHGFPARATVTISRVEDLRESDRWPWSVLRRPPHGAVPPGEPLETDEVGAFRATDLAPGEYLVRAESGGVRASESVRLDLPGVHERVVLRLGSAPGAPIRGRVAWADGSPFRGFVAAGGEAAATDEEGGFALADTGGGEGRLLLWARGRFDRKVIRPVAAEGAELRLVADRDLVPIAGRVTAGGAPVAGADVVATTHSREERTTTLVGATTDAEGRFRVAGGPDSQVYARAEGFLSTIVPAPESGRELAIRLSPAPVVTGRVVSAVDGRPGANLPVCLVEISHDPIDSGGFWSTATTSCLSDGRGRFTLVSPVAGDVMVFVFGRGFVTPGISEATDDGYNPAALHLEPGERTDIDVPVLPSPSLAGRLTDPAGLGVAGATIDASAAYDPTGRRGWTMNGLGDLATGVTGPDGAFRIATLIPGLAYTVSAWPSRREGAEAGPVVPEGDEECRIDLALPTEAPDRYVVVTVVAAEGGKPVEGASAWVERQSGEGTGADGRARLGPLGRGPLAVSAEGPGYAPSDPVVVPGADGQDRALAVTVELPTGKVIAGRALFPDGSPAMGGEIAVGVAGTREQRVRRERTGAEGEFRIDDLREGDYEVAIMVQTPDGRSFAGSAQAEAGTEGLLVALERSGWDDARARSGSPGEGDGPVLEVRVLGPEAEAVPAGEILTRTWNEYSTGRGLLARSDPVPIEAGRATRRFGRYEQSVWLDVRPAPSTGLGPALVGPCRAEDSPVTIRLAAATTIRGTVTGPDGTGVRGARVFAVPMNPEMKDRGETPSDHGAAWAGAGGRFAVTGLGAGEYFLFVAGPPDLCSEGPVLARGGEDVDLPLVAAESAMITVLDDRGRPVAEAEVRVHPVGADRPLYSRDAMVRAVAGADGVARLRGLPPGRKWVLVVEPSWSQDDLAKLEVDPWTAEDGTVRLLPVGHLSGRVVDTDGFVVPWAELVWRREDGKEETVSVRPDGTFEIRGAPAEEMRLLAALPETKREEPGWTEFVSEEGRLEVEVVIPPGPSVTVRVEGWPAGAAAVSHWYWSVGGWSSYPEVPVRADGTARLHHAPPEGRYAFHVALPDGRMAHAPEIAPSSEEQVLPLRPGRTMAGKLVLPAGAHDVRFSLWGTDLMFHVPVAPGGAFSVPGLPDGSYLLSAYASVGETRYEGKVTTEPATDVEIRLVPSPK